MSILGLKSRYTVKYGSSCLNMDTIPLRVKYMQLIAQLKANESKNEVEKKQAPPLSLPMKIILVQSLKCGD